MTHVASGANHQKNTNLAMCRGIGGIHLNTTMCEHTLETLTQPMALVVQPDAAQYLCPSCLADWVWAELKAGRTADAVASQVHVGDRCDHLSEGQTCFGCRDACLSYLSGSGLKDISLRIINRDQFPSPAREAEQAERKRRTAAVEARQAQYFRWDRRRAGIRA